MKIQDVIQAAKEKWPLQQAEDFDNVGLLCGNLDREVTGILICHDSLESVVEEAIQKNCNLIIAFHPIIFSTLKSLTGRNYVGRAVIKALENKIAIYALHTALDNDWKGVNHRICNELGLNNLRVLMPKAGALSYLQVYVPKENAESLESAIFSAGAGQIGNYDLCNYKIMGTGSFRPLQDAHPTIGKQGNREFVEEAQLNFIFESWKTDQITSAMRKAHPYEEVAYQIYALENENHFEGLGQYGDFGQAMDEIEFLKFVKEKFQLKIIRHSGLLNKKIKRVGVIGGSGVSGIAAAKKVHCDAFLCGDFKYHDFFKAEGQILLADIGHFESERFVIEQLFEFFSEKFSKFAVLKSEVNTNPVNYFL